MKARVTRVRETVHLHWQRSGEQVMVRDRTRLTQRASLAKAVIGCVAASLCWRSKRDTYVGHMCRQKR